jgi:hypothetical protein
MVNVMGVMAKMSDSVAAFLFPGPEEQSPG